MSVSTEQQRAPRAAPGRIPDFFLVGHAKSGTTALYEMLGGHPRIYMSPVKEPQFFARNPTPPASPAGAKSFERTGRQAVTVEEYMSLFAGAAADQLIGDASTFHIWSPVAAERIARAQPDARIIVILREPASFLHSLHLQMLKNHSEIEQDLRKAIALEGPRREGRRIPRDAHWPAALMYSDRVRYVEQLQRYHAVFPREQVLVLIYEDFRADNAATVRTVLRFLGVDDAAPVQVVQANPTVAVRSVRLYGVVRDIRAGRGPLAGSIRAVTRALTTPTLRRSVLHPLRRRLVYGTPAPAQESLLRDLRLRFKDEVVALSEHLDRDLVRLWGYDSLG
jgi:hypothetical protein